MTKVEELIAKWLETADTWERQNREPYARKPRENVPLPPERSRGAIQNWVNWLRGCARDLEAAIDADAKNELDAS